MAGWQADEGKYCKAIHPTYHCTWARSQIKGFCQIAARLVSYRRMGHTSVPMRFFISGYNTSSSASECTVRSWMICSMVHQTVTEIRLNSCNESVSSASGVSVNNIGEQESLHHPHDGP